MLNWLTEAHPRLIILVQMLMKCVLKGKASYNFYSPRASSARLQTATSASFSVVDCCPSRGFVLKRAHGWLSREYRRYRRRSAPHDRLTSSLTTKDTRKAKGDVGHSCSSLLLAKLCSTAKADESHRPNAEYRFLYTGPAICRCKVSVFTRCGVYGRNNWLYVGGCASG